MNLFSEILHSLVTPRADANPDDERFWSTDGMLGVTSSGIGLTTRLALQVSCLYAGVRIYAETIGALPLKFYRERAEGQRDVAKDSQLWWLFRHQPNPWQTPQQFRETLTAFEVAWGAGYAEIRPGPNGPVDSLIPLHPDTVTVEQLENYRLRFKVREQGRPERTLVQDQVFRIEGLALHRYIPENVLLLAREAISLWLAHEKFAGLFFGQGASPGGLWLKHPKKLSDQAYQRLREEAQQRMGGWGNFHKIRIAEEGMEPTALGANAKDSQMTETKQALVGEMARWLNLPPRMLGVSGSTRASAEQDAREFVDYSLMPHARRWEQSIDRDLIFEEGLYAEHLFDGLLRGNTRDRFESYAIGIMNGFMSENEVRQRENLEPYPGLDEPRRSVNQDRGADPRRDGRAADDDEPPRRNRSSAAPPPRRLRLIAESAARHVVRREIPAIRDKAVKLAGKAATWAVWVTEFYAEHATFVAESLQLEPALARAYADRHRDQLLAEGLEVLARWETAAIQELTALAVEEEPDHV